MRSMIASLTRMTMASLSKE